MSTFNNLTPSQLREAADLQESIEASQKRLEQLLTGKVMTFKGGKKTSTANATPIPANGTTPKRVLSPEARQKIADGQKRRWAKQAAAAATAEPAAPATPAPVAAVA